MKVLNIILDQKFIDKYKLPFKGFIVDQKEMYKNAEKIYFFLKEKLALQDDETSDITWSAKLVEINEEDENYSNLYQPPMMDNLYK